MMRGVPVECICDRAADADLIVMTSHGRTGLSRAWLGSVADGIMRRTTIPVLMLRPENKSGSRAEARTGFKRILVPIDGSKLAGEALGPAIDLAKAVNADLALFRAVHPIPLAMASDPTTPISYQPEIVDEEATALAIADVQEQFATLAGRLEITHGIKVFSQVVADARSADAILEFAREHEIDCIAMTTHGRGASRLLWGSIADKVLRGAHIPVLLRRPIGVVENYLGSVQVSEHVPAAAGHI
jgi:nucleotide-binding universal stress UspA family protein